MKTKCSKGKQEIKNIFSLQLHSATFSDHISLVFCMDPVQSAWGIFSLQNFEDYPLEAPFCLWAVPDPNSANTPNLAGGISSMKMDYMKQVFCT